MRNLVPKGKQLALKVSQKDDPLDAVATLTDATGAQLDAVVSFLNQEHPRGPLPQGPASVAAAAKADSIRLAWLPELKGATVDFYAIWRAAAGTSGSPTTPPLSSALRVAVVPTGRASRSPVGSGFEWFDLNFSSGDRSGGTRFKYWVSSIDNEWRESSPVDFGIATVPAATGGAGGGNDILDWLGW